MTETTLKLLLAIINLKISNEIGKYVFNQDRTSSEKIIAEAIETLKSSL